MTEFNWAIFIWRAIIFASILTIFTVASIIAKNNTLHKRRYRRNKRVLLKIRWVVVAFLYLIGLAIAVFAIYEIIKNHSNRWLIFKISCYILFWVIAILLPLVDAKSKKLKWVEPAMAVLEYIGTPIVMVGSMLVSLMLVC